MSSPDWPKNDPLDILLERKLKGWAQRHSPAQNARRELLFKAAVQEMVTNFEIPILGFLTSKREVDVHRQREVLNSHLVYSLHFSPARMIM